MTVHASKSKTLVNNIPMSTIYAGMNAARYKRLQEVYTNTIVDVICDESVLDETSEDEFNDIVAQRFYAACQRKANKAGWYARIHNIKRKAFK